MTDKEIIAVVQAHSEGKEIQWKPVISPESNWANCVTGPIWNFQMNDYRVKRAPREWWLNVYGQRGLDNIAHVSSEAADRAAYNKRTEKVHVLEILPEEEK